MKNLKVVSLVEAIVLVVVLALLSACAVPAPQVTAPEAAEKEAAAPAPEAMKPWELIDWNKPVPMTERLLADEYILPEGWDKATEGVDEIVFFNSGALKDDIATAIGMKLFEQKTGIKVKALEVGGAYTFPKFLSVVTSKDPSVDFGFIRAEVEYAHVASAGWAHPIDELWPPDVQALYSPGLVDALRWDDHFYGSVNIVQWYVFFYRPSWFEAAGVEQVPETWQDVFEVAKKTRAWAKENLGDDYYGIVFGASKSGHIHIAYLSALTYSQGATLLKDGDWNLDTPEFRNAWNYMVALMKEDVADVACLGYGWKDYHTVFGVGKAAQALAYSVYAVKFDEDFPELQGDWAAVPPPKWDASQPDSNRVGYINFDVYMINNFADERHKAAAMLFLDFYRSKEAGMYELLVEGNDAMLPAVYEDPDIVDKVDWDFAREVAREIGAVEPVKRGIAIPEVRAASARTARIEALPPGAAYVSDILSEYLGKAVTEGMDSNAALDEALAKVEEYIH